MTLPTTKHALVIQGSEEETKKACIEIRDWAVKNGIPIASYLHSYDFLKEGILIWNGYYLEVAFMNGFLHELGYVFHHTVESFKKVFEAEESEINALLIEFAEWYFGMERKEILKAVERWKKESTIQEFKPIELKNLTNPKN